MIQSMFQDVHKTFISCRFPPIDVILLINVSRCAQNIYQQYNINWWKTTAESSDANPVENETDKTKKQAATYQHHCSILGHSKV